MANQKRPPVKPRPKVNTWLLIIVSGVALTALSLGVIATSIFYTPATSAAVVLPTPTVTATPIITPTPFAPTSKPPVIHTAFAYVVDPDTGTVLLSRNGAQPHAMASTTKMMTALIAILYGKLDQVMTVPQEVHQLDGTGASCMCVLPGQKYTLRQLLYGLLLPSGDDAAITIAVGMDGSQATFVTNMNQLADWMGLTHTHYTNVHGLDAVGHQSSAEDLARLAEVALTLPTFRQIVAANEYIVPATTTHSQLTLKSTNALLVSGKSLGVDGVKTGHTGNAGYCLVSEARRNGHRLIIVILNEQDPYGDTQRFTDTTALITWGFQQELVYAAPPPTPIPGVTPSPSPTK